MLKIVEARGGGPRRPAAAAVTVTSLLALLASADPVCAADLDLTAGVLGYAAPPGDTIANALTVSLVDDVYTVADPAETTVTPTANALAAGCVAVDATTVTCPAAAVTSLTVTTRAGDDSIVLVGVAAPALVVPGQGNDAVLGGDGDDVIQWNPGDASDVVDGGPGNDTLLFNGANVSEAIMITTDGPGFDLSRNIGNVTLDVDDVEVLDLRTAAGSDAIQTTPLHDTTQHITTAAGDTAPGTLTIDGKGLCLTQRSDRFDVEGRPPIFFSGFTTILTGDVFCRPDPCLTTGPTLGCTVNGVPNQLCQVPTASTRSTAAARPTCASTRIKRVRSSTANSVHGGNHDASLRSRPHDPRRGLASDQSAGRRRRATSGRASYATRAAAYAIGSTNVPARPRTRSA